MLSEHEAVFPTDCFALQLGGLCSQVRTCALAALL